MASYLYAGVYLYLDQIEYLQSASRPIQMLS